MERKLRIVQYGCGKMSKYTMHYVYEKGAQIVGAFDINDKIIGKDISEIIGGDKKGITIQSIKNAEEILKDLKPDACIITTMSLLEDVKDALLLCAKLGINAITTCEEAFYPENSNPNLTKEIDWLAKNNNCTITGSGYQDIFWGQLITSICGATHNIKKIVGESWYNVEDYGLALAKAHGAGLTLEQFDKEIASTDRMTDEKRKEIIDSGKYTPSYMWNVCGWLCEKLDLHIQSQTQKCIPETYNQDIESQTLGMTIKKGDATGMSAVVYATTKEGVDLEIKCVGKVYAKEEFDKNEWTIIGQPDTTITVKRPSTVELTCATIVNRIPDLINEKPGFIPTSSFEDLKYKVKPLNEYIK